MNIQIKKCKVSLNNEEVTCVKYGDISVQFPSIHRKAEYLYVGLDENGAYFITNEPCVEVAESEPQEEIAQIEPVEQEIVHEKPKSKKKKTTKKNV